MKDKIISSIVKLTLDRPKDNQGIYLESTDLISKELNSLDNETYNEVINELKEKYNILLIYGWLSEYCISW